MANRSCTEGEPLGGVGGGGGCNGLCLRSMGCSCGCAAAAARYIRRRAAILSMRTLRQLPGPVSILRNRSRKMHVLTACPYPSRGLFVSGPPCSPRRRWACIGRSGWWRRCCSRSSPPPSPPPSSSASPATAAATRASAETARLGPAGPVSKAAAAAGPTLSTASLPVADTLLSAPRRGRRRRRRPADTSCWRLSAPASASAASLHWSGTG